MSLLNRIKIVRVDDEKIVIERQPTEIHFEEKVEMGQIKYHLKTELASIAKQVKSLKERATEIKETLAKIEGQEKEPIKKP
jgi:hypothetical protein